MKGRLILVTLVLGLWAGGIVARLCQLQIVDYEIYRQRAEGQHHRRVVLQPPRGTIYDIRGRELALSVEVDSVWADPSQIEHDDVFRIIVVRDPRGFYRQLPGKVCSCCRSLGHIFSLTPCPAMR